jgi:hypothetical protein
MTKYFNNQIKRMRWVEHVARSVLLRKPESKGQVGRPRHTWDDNKKKDLK